MMKIFVPVLLLLLPSLVSALRADRLATQEQDPPARQLGSLCTQCETVQIAFHILGNSAGNNKAAAYWHDNRINWEVDFLNERWASTPFKFMLRKVTRQTNNNWSSGNVYDPVFISDVVDKLRAGGRTTVNVFVNDGNVCGFSGYAKRALSLQFFPVDEFSLYDWVFLCGGTRNNNILLHELGHWLRLAQ